MFLTTVRVRRARPQTIGRLLTAKQQSDVHKHTNVLEVMAHGEVVAVAQALPQGAAVLWMHADLPTLTRGTLVDLVAAALSLMGAANRSGLCESSEPPDAPARPRTRGTAVA